MLLTWGDLKASGVAARVNLCPDDPRFLAMANRLVQLLLSHGSWWGTVRRAAFCITDSCLVLPGCVASLDGVFSCCHAHEIKTEWYRFLNPNPPCSTEGALIFEPFGTIPTSRSMCAPGVIRSYVASLLDLGRKITFQGYDLNNVWVRTLNAGVMQDGETVVLNTPWVDTLTTFSSVTAVQKEETKERVNVFTHAPGNSILTPLATYEYWETRPDYRRYRISGGCGNTGSSACADGNGDGTNCSRYTVEAMVKLEYMPMRRDEDYLLIGNLAALELGLEALKAKDDGDLQKADALLFGNSRNQRLGAIPILNQEIQTYTGGRFWARVQLPESMRMRRVMAGFI